MASRILFELRDADQSEEHLNFQSDSGTSSRTMQFASPTISMIALHDESNI